MRERIRLTIVGTGVELDAMGLPCKLRGDIHETGAGSEPGRRVGTYSEEVEPILAPDLRGTLGVSRLEIEGGAVVTDNISLITGSSPEGDILVRSSGRVVSGEGRYTGARGSLRTESRVRLNPFAMRVDVTLVMGGRSGAGSRSRRRARARSGARWRPGSYPRAAW